MKKLTTSIVAVASLIGAPAFAADMAVKAPPPAPAPVYSWTGWYVGLNAGGGWQTATIDNSVLSNSFNTLGHCACVQCGNSTAIQYTSKRIYWWRTDRLQLSIRAKLGRRARSRFSGRQHKKHRQCH